MNRRALIGVLPIYDKSLKCCWMIPGYMQGVLDAGGLPAILPLTSDETALESIARTYDGLLFTGGSDIDPSHYGQAPIPECGETCPERDAMETSLFRLALELDKPMLGICRGAQLFNVMLGGSLYQDIPTGLSASHVDHNQKKPYDRPIHSLNLVENEFLSDILETDKIWVNSAHHQGVLNPAPGIVPLARSYDGLIESFRLPGKRFLLAVQWHPELSIHSDEYSPKIFSSFVRACAE
ncbi:MAG: gamma-glutamyl-gamma-aminobutyrate hydrolase family protein [Synergistaceae bacterium]|nr:gamma-glutamyl-gamma-aminobutyrate hydrolase family protein [Synergistaceae bacterium]